MKILFIALLFISFNVNAGGYVGIYNQSLLSNQSETGNEIENEMPLATIVLGAEIGSKFGANAEILFNSNGGGASAGLFAKKGSFTFSGGVTIIPDYSKGAVTGFNDTASIEDGKGFYLGVKYKLVSVRYIQYEVDHTYNAQKITGSTGTPPVPVYAFGSSQDTLKRNVLWIGATVPF
jgi:hypothetical protein